MVSTGPPGAISASVGVNRSTNGTPCCPATRPMASVYRASSRLRAVHVHARQPRQPLVRDGRHEHQAWCAGAVVLRGKVRAEVGGQILLELSEPRLAVERLVETEEGEDDVRLLPVEMRGRGPEIERARLQRDRVAAPAQVPHRQLQVRETRRQQRLEVVEQLHALGERVADEHDAVAWL